MDVTKWRSNVRNVAILFAKPSQFRKFAVEVGLVPQLCVIIEENSQMPEDFYFFDCSYEPVQDQPSQTTVFTSKLGALVSLLHYFDTEKIET